MKKEIIKNKIDIDEQFDIELQSCSDDCIEYFGKGLSEVRMIQSQGINATNPTTSQIRRGVQLAKDLGISYCYRMNTPKTSIYL